MIHFEIQCNNLISTFGSLGSRTINTQYFFCSFRTVDRARASFRAGLTRTGVVGPPRARNRPRAGSTNLPHRLPDGTIIDEDASENW